MVIFIGPHIIMIIKNFAGFEVCDFCPCESSKFDEVAADIIEMFHGVGWVRCCGATRVTTRCKFFGRMTYTQGIIRQASIMPRRVFREIFVTESSPVVMADWTMCFASA